MVQYTRETLYEEVWNEPVSTVAKKYGVSDVAIHKICKSMDIPVPPRGYWAKKRAGQKVQKTPLPKTDKRSTIARYYSIDRKPPKPEPQLMDILPEEEYKALYKVAGEIEMQPEGTRYHKTIAAFKSMADTWKKDYGKLDHYDNRYRNNPPPELIKTVSDEGRRRVYRLLDSLVKGADDLGVDITDDLNLIVRKETVPIVFSEAKDTNDHILTKKEERELAEYEIRKQKYSWETRPNIRKYDHVFNGKLTMKINKDYVFRDSPSTKIEERLDEILLALYKASEDVRIERLRREEAARQAAEEQRQREHRLQMYNAEVKKTNALVNAANDYEIACRIRKYVEHVSELFDSTDPKKQEWLAWAEEKADWFDPAIASEDPIFGVRKHTESNDQKELKTLYSTWQLGYKHI